MPFFRLFVFLILLTNYLALCSERHSPKRNDRAGRNHHRHSKTHDEHHKNVKPHDDHHKNGKTNADHHYEHKKRHEDGNLHGKHSPEKLVQSRKTKQHIAHHSTSDNNNNKAKKQSAEHKQLSLHSCEERGRNYFTHCFEVNSKTGQCHTGELPMRIKDCSHLKKFINTNLHTLVEASPTVAAAAGELHGHHVAAAVHHVHADGEHVGAFVTAKNVMCCSVDRENALHHAIQLINNRLMFAHELALYRFAHEIPVDDPEREATVLKSVGNQANAAGIDAEFAVNFLLAQMEANKMIQRGYIERWNSDHSFESKYVPDLEKEIQPKMTYTTNAVILALLPFAGHQLYEDENCVDHVEHMLASMEHLRASEMEPNGKLAIEKATRGLCDKVLIHHDGQNSTEEHSKSVKRRKLTADKEHEKRAHKTGSRTDSKSMEPKPRRRAHSPEKKEKIRKASPRRNVEGGSGKRMDDKNELKNTGKKSPRRIEVSDRSIMIKPGDNTRELSQEYSIEDKMTHESEKARPEEVDKKANIFDVGTAKSPKKSPRRIEVSDRSVLIKMDEMNSDESQDIYTTNKKQENSAQSEQEGRDKNNNEKVHQNSESGEHETEAYSRNQFKKSPFKVNVPSTGGDQSGDREGTDHSRKESVLANLSRQISIDNEVRNASILKQFSRSTSFVHENPRKDSLLVYRRQRRLLGSSKSNGSDENYSSQNEQRFAREDKSENEKVGPTKIGRENSAGEKQSVKGEEEGEEGEGGQAVFSASEAATPSRMPTKMSSAAEEHQQGNDGSMENGRHKFSAENFLKTDERGQWNDQENSLKTNVGIEKMGKREESGEFHHIELEPDAESIVIHTGGEKPVKIKLSRKAAKGNEAPKEGANGKIAEQEEAQQKEDIEMDDKEEENGGGISGGKSAEIHLNREGGGEAEEGEEEKEKRRGKAAKNKFKVKRAESGAISAEEKTDGENVHVNDVRMAEEKMQEQREEENLRISPKKSFKMKRVGSAEENTETDKEHKKAEGIDEQMTEQSNEALKNSVKNKFKIKKVGSDEQTETDQVYGEQSDDPPTKSSPIDKSNEYVMAPEKISHEFAEKSDELNREIGDHSANLDNEQ